MRTHHATAAALVPLARAPLERYGALVINEFAGLDDLHITTVLGAGTVSSPPLTGEDILRCFGFRKGESGRAARALGARRRTSRR